MSQIKLNYRVIDLGEEIIYDLGKSITITSKENYTIEEHEEIEKQIILDTADYAPLFKEEFMDIYLVDKDHKPYYHFSILNEEVREDILDNEDIYNDISEVPKYVFMYIADYGNRNDYTAYLEGNEDFNPIENFPFQARLLQRAEWEQKPLEEQFMRNMYTDGKIVSFNVLKNRYDRSEASNE